MLQLSKIPFCKSAFGGLSYRFSDLFLTLYLFALFANRTGSGFDYYFLRISFVLYVISALFFDVLPDVRNHSRHKLFNSYTAWFVCFLFLTYFSVVWSLSSKDTLSSVYISSFAQALCLAILIPNRVRDRDDFKSVAFLVVLAAVYCVACLLLKTPSSAWGTERVGEAIGVYSNGLGSQLAIASMFAMYLSRTNRAPLYYLLTVVFGIVIMFTGSRLSFLFFLGGTALLLVLWNRGWKAVLAIVVAIGGVVLLINFAMTNDLLYNVLGRRLERLSGSVYDASAIERDWYRAYAFQMFLDKPVLGYGFNGFYSQMRFINYSHQAYSHCGQSELLADLGIVGFLLYYGMFLAIVKNAFSERRRNKVEAVFIFVFVVLVFAFDWGKISFIHQETYLYLGMFYALLASIQKTESKNKEKGNRNVDLA